MTALGFFYTLGSSLAEDTTMPQWIVYIWGPYDCGAVGTFATQEAALRWAEVNIKDPLTFSVFELQHPSEYIR